MSHCLTTAWQMKVLNKTDLLSKEAVQPLAELFLAESKADIVIPVAAKYGTGVRQVKDWACQQLKEGPSLYPKVREHGHLSAHKMSMSTSTQGMRQGGLSKVDYLDVILIVVSCPTLK